jgi:hypothetical protein
MYVSNPPKVINYCFGAWQPLFEQMEREFPFITFHKGLPGEEMLKPSEKHTLFYI